MESIFTSVLYGNATSYILQINLKLILIYVSNLLTHLQFSSVLWWENLIKLSIHYPCSAMLPLGGSVVSHSLLTVGLNFEAWLQDGFTKVSLFVYIPSTRAPSSANATPEFEGRGGEELGVELSNTLYKVFNNKHSVDLKGLCISAGEHCWVLYVDVLASINRHLLEKSVISTAPLSVAVPGQDS